MSTRSESMTSATSMLRSPSSLLRLRSPSSLLRLRSTFSLLRLRSPSSLPRLRSPSSLFTALLAFACLAAAATTARSDVSAAARAFSEGQAAQLDGKFERAADAFELAYSIQPTKEALRSAARMRMQAGHLARAAHHAALLIAEYGDDLASVTLAESILREAEPSLCRLAISCEAPGCSLSTGGRALSMSTAEEHVVYVTPGELELVLSFGAQQVTRRLRAQAGARIDLHVDAPPPPSPTESAVEMRALAPQKVAASRSRGWPRLVVYAGAGLTAALGGVTLWSGLDTESAHDDYVKAPTSEGWDDGRQKQLRTNILLGATAAAALATVAIAVFHTDWSGESSRLTVAPSGDGATLGFATSF